MLEIMSSNVSTTFITCPADPQKTLGIKLPFLVMIVKVRTTPAACAVVAGLHQASCCMLGMRVMEVAPHRQKAGKSPVWCVLGQHGPSTHATFPHKTACAALPAAAQNMKKYFSFEVQVLDDKNVRRRFRASNYQVLVTA